jgi:hypothetical protein
MFENLDDPVDVLTAYVGGKLQPLRFRWKGRVVRIRRVTGRWERREGSVLLHHFAVEGHGAESYELRYDPRGLKWTLQRAWNP